MKLKFRNRLIFAYFSLLLLLVCPIVLSAQCWKHVWADEFVGNSVDETKWRYGYGNPYGLLNFYTDRTENVFVSDGTLKIIARKEAYNGFNYTSGLLKIKDNLGWRYGKIEASIKLPGTPGFVPAFWMMPINYHYGWWPTCGEIDIMEYVTTMPPTIYGTIHSKYYNWFSGIEVAKGGTVDVPGAETAFHVYAIEWTENKIDFFVDGNKYFTYTDPNSGFEKWPFDQPFSIILNLAVGGDWCGPPTENTVFPAVMEIDYVRVYQYLDDIKISGVDYVEYNSENVTYTVPEINDATYSWDIPGGAEIVSGQNTSKVEVNWNYFGGDLKASVSSDGCSETIEYPVMVSSNILKNPGFEKGVKYWISRVSHLVSANTQLTTEEAHSGDF